MDLGRSAIRRAGIVVVLVAVCATALFLGWADREQKQGPAISAPSNALVPSDKSESPPSSPIQSEPFRKEHGNQQIQTILLVDSSGRALACEARALVVSSSGDAKPTSLLWFESQPAGRIDLELDSTPLGIVVLAPGYESTVVPPSSVLDSSTDSLEVRLEESSDRVLVHHEYIPITDASMELRLNLVGQTGRSTPPWGLPADLNGLVSLISPPIVSEKWGSQIEWAWSFSAPGREERIVRRIGELAELQPNLRTVSLRPLMDAEAEITLKIRASLLPEQDPVDLAVFWENRANAQHRVVTVTPGHDQVSRIAIPRGMLRARHLYVVSLRSDFSLFQLGPASENSNSWGPSFELRDRELHLVLSPASGQLRIIATGIPAKSQATILISRGIVIPSIAKKLDQSLVLKNRDSREQTLRGLPGGKYVVSAELLKSESSAAPAVLDVDRMSSILSEQSRISPQAGGLQAFQDMLSGPRVSSDGVYTLPIPGDGSLEPLALFCWEAKCELTVELEGPFAAECEGASVALYRAGVVQILGQPRRAELELSWDGGLTFSGQVAPGKYEVEVRSVFGFRPNRRIIRIPSRDRHREAITLDAERSVRIKLQCTHRHLPAGLMVELFEIPGSFQVPRKVSSGVIGPDRASAFTGWSPGLHMVKLHGLPGDMGFQASHNPLEIQKHIRFQLDADTAEVVLELHPGHLLQFNVIGAHGEIPDQGQIQLEPTGEQGRVSARITSGGRVSVLVSKPGSYTPSNGFIRLPLGAEPPPHGSRVFFDAEATVATGVAQQSLWFRRAAR